MSATQGHGADLKVGVVELVGDVPSEHEELASFEEDGVEIAEAEEQLAVLLLSVAAGELLLRDEAIQALQVSLQALQGQQRVRLAFRPCRDNRGSG